MLNKIKNYLKSQIRGTAEVVVLVLVKTFKLDSRRIFYASNGILKYKDHESGEQWFIDRILPHLLYDIDEPVLLDIGANVGQYSIALAKSIPSSRCYAFEPNPVTFARLAANTRSTSNIKPVNYGAGSKKENIELFVYKSDSSTAHASLYKDVFTKCHLQDDASIEVLTCAIEKIDDLIGAGIVPEDVVHFIKIDTEGHELEGLKGLLSTIRGRGVRVVQFEFNEMNVISRVFLKDFYDLLGDEWDFFRLDTQNLISLGSRYDSANEIFKFQNIIAIRRTGFPDLGLLLR